MVVVVAAMVVGIGILASLNGDAGSDSASAIPTSSAAAAAATARPTPRPTPIPTPAPTLAPMLAPAAEARLSPTGVLLADTGDPSIEGLVADVDGTVWGIRAGGVMNIDPVTGRTREWTIADDPAFMTGSLTAARHGGVWLVGPEAVRLFDGTRFRAVIDVPAPVGFMAEDDDGTLWAQVDEYGLVRWSDGMWQSDPPGRPSRQVRDLVVDVDGRVWTANVDESADGLEVAKGISVWDGSAWTDFDPDELKSITSRGDPPSLIVSADGGVWATLWSHLERYEAGSWTTYEVEGLGGGMSVNAVDEEGRVWFAGDGCESCTVLIKAYDGSTVTSFAGEDGLPGAGDVDSSWVEVLAGPGYTLASTQAGLYRLADGRWERLDQGPSVAQPPGWGRGGDVSDIVASSRDEAWAVRGAWDGWSDGAQGGGLYRFDGTTWKTEPLPVEATLGRAALAPDGALWVATSSGPLVLRDGSWTDLGDLVGEAASVAGEFVDDECGGIVFVGGDGIAYYAGPRSTYRVVALRPAGATWEALPPSAPPLDAACWGAFAATADGSIWVLERGWGNVLSRSTGGPWRTVSLPRAPADGWSDPSAIAVDRDGTLWVAMTWFDPDGDTAHVELLRRVDEEWVRYGSELSGYVRSLATLPDGSLIAIGDGIAVFDGGDWRWWLRDSWFGSASVAPDGTVWVAGPNVYRLPATIP